MKGLDCNEINFTSIVSESIKLRIDSGYYSKRHIVAQKLVETQPRGYTTLGEITKTLRKGIFDIKSDTYLEEGIPFVRISNLKDCIISESNLAYISSEAHSEESKTALRKNDFILSKTAYAAASLVTVDECNVSQDTIACVLSSQAKKTFSSAFIVVYLNSRFGLALTLRMFQGNVQLHLSLPDAFLIPVPILSSAFQGAIERIFDRSVTTRSESKLLFEKAKQALLAAIKLEDWHPPTPLTYEARASEAFQSDRLDAEFFQPRIKELYQLLGDKTQCISDVSDLRQDRFNSTKNQINYLEIGAVSSDGIIADSIIDGDEAPSRATWHVERGDVLTSTVRPIRGLTAIIEDSQHGSVASSGFAVLTPKGISPELLLCYLKLPQICELMDLHTSASMYPAISVPDILGLPFKHPGKEAEEKIVSLIQEARAKRANSKSLLERAKRAVEIAIEESEETALAYLDGKHYLADELLPKLFSPNRHYIDLATVQRTIEAEALVYEATTINRYLHEWTREGRIHDAGRGWYSNLRNAFHPNLKTPPLPELEKLLKNHFPLLEFTIWSTCQLTTFFHHHAARHATFLMVDRDAMDAVANVLLNAGHHTVIHPLGDAAKNFALTQDETIILRPRLSSDHKETYAPIEQMLVDLHHEIQKLGLFDLDEFRNVFENLSNRYRLNIPALKRYAERRKTDSTELLKLGGII